MSEHVHVSTIRTALHSGTVRVTQVDGEWWAQTTADGRVLAYECLGPVDEVHPPLPRITHERRTTRKRT